MNHCPCSCLWFQVGDLARTDCIIGPLSPLLKYVCIAYWINPVEIYFSCWGTQRLSELDQNNDPWATVRSFTIDSLIWRFPIFWRTVIPLKFCRKESSKSTHICFMDETVSSFPDITSRLGDLTCAGLGLTYRPPTGREETPLTISVSKLKLFHLKGREWHNRDLGEEGELNSNKLELYVEF